VVGGSWAGGRDLRAQCRGAAARELGAQGCATVGRSCGQVVRRREAWGSLLQKEGEEEESQALSRLAPPPARAGREGRRDSLRAEWAAAAATVDCARDSEPPSAPALRDGLRSLEAP